MSKRKPSRKQQKERKQEATHRARWRNVGARKPELKFDVDFSAVDRDLLADVRGAFKPGGVVSPAAMSELVLDSHHLFEEPELEGVLANPILAVTSFFVLAESAGLEPFETDTEQLAPLIFELSPHLLAEDPDLRNDLIDALEKLRARLKRRRRYVDAGRAAMTQLLLQHGQDSSWRLIGLVQRVVTSSVFAGLRMGEIEDEIERVTRTPLEALQAEDLAGDLPDKLHELLDSDPALRAYLDRKMDDMWEEGLKALLRGELQMPLFTAEEVNAAVEVLSPRVVMHEDKIDFRDDGPGQPFHELVQNVLSERRQQMAEDLTVYLASGRVRSGDKPFLRLAHEALADETGDELLTFRAVGVTSMALIHQALVVYLERLQEEE